MKYPVQIGAFVCFLIFLSGLGFAQQRGQLRTESEPPRVLQSDSQATDGPQRFGCVEGNCVNGSGTYVQNNSVKLVGEFVDSSFMAGTRYNPDGTKRDKGEYEGNHLVDGTLYVDGMPSTRGHHNESGRLHGIGTHYSPDGDLRVEGVFQDGLLISGTKYRHGNKFEEGTYQYGDSLSEGIKYDEAGNIYERGQFESDHLINGSRILLNRFEVAVIDGEIYETLRDKRWKYIGHTEEAVIFLDTETVGVRENVFTIRTKHKDRYGAHNLKEQEIDCHEGRIRTIGKTIFSRFGRSSASSSSPSEWNPVISGSPDDDLLASLCEDAPNRKTD